jgi:hypothetical protein
VVDGDAAVVAAPVVVFVTAACGDCNCGCNCGGGGCDGGGGSCSRGEADDNPCRCCRGNGGNGRTLVFSLIFDSELAHRGSIYRTGVGGMGDNGDADVSVADISGVGGRGEFGGALVALASKAAVAADTRGL